jgi:hypothetical protein
MKTDFKLQIDEVSGAWLLTLDRSRVPISYPQQSNHEKRMIEQILRHLSIHRKFRVEET